MAPRVLPRLALLGLLAGVALGTPRPAAADGVTFAAVDLPFADVLARARAIGDGRLLVAELFTERCAWCRALERDVFASPDVGRALAGDLCVRYDADSGPGRPVAERFRVGVFPTTLFLSAGGDEVDRLVGYFTPGRFLEEVARIRSGRETLRSLRAAHEAAPDEVVASVAYARKLARAGDADGATKLLAPVVEPGSGGGPALPAALLGLAEIACRAGDATGAQARLGRLLDEHGDAPEAADGWILRIDLLARAGAFDRAREAAIEARKVVRGDARLAALEERVATIERLAFQATLLRWGERADAAGDLESLGRAAKAALDRRLLLGTALRWAERVAKAAPEDTVSVGVHADLLFETGSPEKALSVASAALDASRDAADRALFARRIAFYRASLARPPPPPPPTPPGGDTLPPPAPAGPAPAPVPPSRETVPPPVCPEPVPAPPCPPGPVAPRR